MNTLWMHIQNLCPSLRSAKRLATSFGPRRTKSKSSPTFSTSRIAGNTSSARYSAVRTSAFGTRARATTTGSRCQPRASADPHTPPKANNITWTALWLIPSCSASSVVGPGCSSNRTPFTMWSASSATWPITSSIALAPITITRVPTARAGTPSTVTHFGYTRRRRTLPSTATAGCSKGVEVPACPVGPPSGKCGGTRFEKLAINFLAMVNLATIKRRLRTLF